MTGFVYYHREADIFNIGLLVLLRQLHSSIDLESAL